MILVARIKKSLVLKTALLSLIAALIPFIVVSFLFFESAKTALHDEIVKGLSNQTDLIRDTLDARLASLRGNAVAWAGLEAMGDILTDDIDKRITGELTGLKEDYRLTGDIHAINSNGVVVASSNPRVIGFMVKDLGAPWLVRALAGEVVAKDLHDSPIDKSRVFGFAVPVRAAFAGGRVIGALLLEPRASGLDGLLLSWNIPMAAVFTSRGEVVVKTEKWPFEAKFSREEAFDREGYIIRTAVSKANYDFAGFGWTVAAVASERDAFLPVGVVKRTSLIVGILGVLWILGLVYFFAGRSVRHLKELSGAAEEIARTKDFSSTVRQSATDEVGRLGVAFNRMLGEINSHLGKIESLEEEMRRADRLSALGELSAGMAHEIKNPLGMIKSSADMLTKRLKGGEEEALAAVIGEEARRLAELLDAFLQFARPALPEMANCNVNDVIERILSLLGPEIDKGSIKVRKELSASVAETVTDPNQLYQVLINLIINATQAMAGEGEGGMLTLKTSMVSAAPLGGESGAELIEIVVADTGAGISKEDRDKIFNPFHTTKDGGTGLGLSITQRIIDGLGGIIKVDEVRPTGTAFKIYIEVRSRGE